MVAGRSGSDPWRTRVENAEATSAGKWPLNLSARDDATSGRKRDVILGLVVCNASRSAAQMAVNKSSLRRNNYTRSLGKQLSRSLARSLSLSGSFSGVNSPAVFQLPLN